MNRAISRSARRMGVIVNFASLVIFIIIFLIGEYGDWNALLGVLAIVAAVIIIASFYYLYIRTNLWRLVHRRVDELDEREIQVTHNSLRHSYTIVSIISLVVIVFITLSVRFSFFTLTHRGHYSFGLIALIALNYVIHTLPASILAWSEREMLIR